MNRSGNDEAATGGGASESWVAGAPGGSGSAANGGAEVCRPKTGATGTESGTEVGLGRNGALNADSGTMIGVGVGAGLGSGNPKVPVEAPGDGTSSLSGAIGAD